MLAMARGCAGVAITFSYRHFRLFCFLLLLKILLDLLLSLGARVLYVLWLAIRGGESAVTFIDMAKVNGGRDTSAVDRLTRVVRGGEVGGLDTYFTPLSMLPGVAFLLVEGLVPPRAVHTVDITDVVLGGVYSNEVCTGVIGGAESVVMRPVSTITGLGKIL